jgi:hypothetical protein
MSANEKLLARANAEAVERILAVTPALTSVARAADALKLSVGELGHAGPPFDDPSQIPRPVLNALAGAAVHEGWAGTANEARTSIIKGQIRLRSNHDLGAVSPMAGVIRPGQMVVRVEDRTGTGATYATLAESGRRSLRFGVYNATSAEGLRWIDATLAPALARALPRDGLPVLPLIAEATCFGDDTHQRNVGGMAAFIRALPNLENDVRAWLFANPQHFLNYAMAAAKLALDHGSGVFGSTIVTAVSRNGVVCAIRVSGAGGRWFTAPATIPQGAYFSPFSSDDAQPDLGDSAIVEAYGLGGAIAHASPELARTMRVGWRSAVDAGRSMRALFTARHPLISPALCGEEGVGVGLDAAKVVAANQSVRIHTGVSHRDGETGWIGVGVAEAPVACFEAAVKALEESDDPANRFA